MAKILLVEDDKVLANMVRTYLLFQHHAVESLEDGSEASHHLKVYDYDLVVLDLELPGMGGIELCQQFRSIGKTTPVIMLTGKTAMTDKVTGLDAGADDYLTKPFTLEELGARIRAQLRRNAGQTANFIQVGDLILDPTRHKVTKAGEVIHLVPKEFQLLEFMMRHPNQVFSGEALLNRVWPADSEATTEALKSTMKRLRNKIDPDGDILKTVRAVGYSLEAP